MRSAVVLIIGVLTAAALLLACGCNAFGGLIGTTVEVRGGRRSLEEQILGSFDHIGDEVYLLAGVRAIDPVSGAPTPPRPMTRSEARALAARRRMEFNRDDVLEFKAAGYVGEGSDGLLVAFDDRMAELMADSPRRFQLVEDVAGEENQDRLVIMQRIVETNPELSGSEGLAAVGRILAGRHRQEAAPGTRVQLPDGIWTTRGEGT
ncbi:MAG: DUF1318 domain-containing protein [Planctomycetota bacterium]|jgi:hypothetical protein